VDPVVPKAVVQSDELWLADGADRWIRQPLGVGERGRVVVTSARGEPVPRCWDVEAGHLYISSADIQLVPNQQGYYLGRVPVAPADKLQDGPQRLVAMPRFSLAWEQARRGGQFAIIRGDLYVSRTGRAIVGVLQGGTLYLDEFDGRWWRKAFPGANVEFTGAFVLYRGEAGIVLRTEDGVRYAVTENGLKHLEPTTRPTTTRPAHGALLLVEKREAVDRCYRFVATDGRWSTDEPGERLQAITEALNKAWQAQGERPDDTGAPGTDQP